MLRSGAMRPLLLGTALAALLGADPAAADLWRWIDADGVPRYTPDPDRVPSAQRSTLVRVEPGMTPTPQREPAVAKPPAIFAPPGDPALATDPWNEPERARAIEGEVVVEMPSGEPASAPAAPPAPTPQAEPAVTPSSPRPPPPEIEGEVVVEIPAVAAATAPAPLPADRAARREELLAAIARDEEALKAHVSSTSDGQLAASAELREIAERLPALQAELRALEAQSAAP